MAALRSAERAASAKDGVARRGAAAAAAACRWEVALFLARLLCARYLVVSSVAWRPLDGRQAHRQAGTEAAQRDLGEGYSAGASEEVPCRVGCVGLDVQCSSCMPASEREAARGRRTDGQTSSTGQPEEWEGHLGGASPCGERELCPQTHRPAD